MRVPSDEEAVAALCAGDTAAFRFLYERYAPRGFSYAQSILHDENDSEDALQEAFCRLLGPVGKGGVDPARGGFRALFFGTIRNLCIDTLRRRARSPRVSLEAAPERILLPPRPGGDESAASEERLETIEKRIRSAIDSLPSNQADVLRLRLKGGLRYEQIARVLGCTRSQVRTWIYRARRTLEKRFLEEGLLDFKRGAEAGHGASDAAPGEIEAPGGFTEAEEIEAPGGAAGPMDGGEP